MNADMQPLPTARELHPEWTPEQARPEIGELAYVIDGESNGDTPGTDSPTSILTNLTGGWGVAGVARLEWFDEHFEGGPQQRGQSFRADHVTSRVEVARMSRRELRELGWKV